MIAYIYIYARTNFYNISYETGLKRYGLTTLETTSLRQRYILDTLKMSTFIAVDSAKQNLG